MLFSCCAKRNVIPPDCAIPVQFPAKPMWNGPIALGTGMLRAVEARLKVSSLELPPQSIPRERQRILFGQEEYASHRFF